MSITSVTSARQGAAGHRSRSRRLAGRSSRLLAVATIVSLALVSAGCQSDASSVKDSTPEQVYTSAPETDVPTDDGDSEADPSDQESEVAPVTFTPAKTFRVTMTDRQGSGWKQRMTLEVAKPIRGLPENLDSIDALWQAAGGTGTAGCIDPESGKASNYGAVQLRYAAVWVGRVSFQNLTPGYEPSDQVWQFVPASVYGVDTSDGVECEVGYGRFSPSFGDHEHWGPTAFILIIGNQYTAATPHGAPDLKKGIGIAFDTQRDLTYVKPDTLPTP